MSSQPIKVSVIGMGMSATVFHIPFIQSLPKFYTLHSILERKATKTHSEARTRYGESTKVVTTLEEILEDPEVQCVVISTPNSTHFPFATAILSAKKHVIIEKPMVATSAEADALIALAQENNCIIATYQNRRYDSDFLTLKKLLDAGKLGDIAEFETRYDRWRPALKGGGTWKEEAGLGNGIVYDLGSHLVDQVLTLFGLPDRVFAHIYNARRLGPDTFHDSFFSQFFYDSVPGSPIPLVVHIHGSPLSAVSPQLRYSVKGTKGAFVKYGIDTQEDQLKLVPPMATDHADFGVEPNDQQGTLTVAGASGSLKAEIVPTEVGRYLGWYENVGEALQARDPALLYVKPDQARNVIRMVELMYESSQNGRVVSAK